MPKKNEKQLETMESVARSVPEVER